MNRRDFVAGMAALSAMRMRSPGFQQVKAAVGGSEVAPRLSVMLWTVFKELPFEQRLEKVAEAGYRSVELVDEFKDWKDADFARVNAKKRALGISFDATAGVWIGLANPGARDKFLDELRHMITIMQKMECDSLIVLSGDRIDGLSHDAQRQSCVDGLKRAADVAEREKITLLLENIDPEENPKYFLTSSREGLDILREVNHPRAKFCYDFYHEQIAEGNLISTLEKNFDLVGLVHVADVPGRHAPGTGEINYTNIFRKLAERNYDRYMAMEFVPSHDPVGELRAARELATAAWSAGRVGGELCSPAQAKAPAPT